MQLGGVMSTAKVLNLEDADAHKITRWIPDRCRAIDSIPGSLTSCASWVVQASAEGGVDQASTDLKNRADLFFGAV